MHWAKLFYDYGTTRVRHFRRLSTQHATADKTDSMLQGLSRRKGVTCWALHSLRVLVRGRQMAGAFFKRAVLVLSSARIIED